MTNPAHLAQLEEWLRSYRPEELFDANGALVRELLRSGPEKLPTDEREPARKRRTAAPGPRASRLPRLRGRAVASRAAARPKRPGCLETWLRDVICANPTTFRLFGPDETASNRLQAVFEVTNRAFDATIIPNDDHLAADGRVMEVLSEHLCEGWLEGYLLTGRHGMFNCYEAFIHIIDSMFNQHAKWLKSSNRSPGGGPSRRSTTSSPPMSGARTTTASPIKIRGFSITS